MQTYDHTSALLDSLLRSELSAVEAYGRAIRKFPDSSVHPELKYIRLDHEENVETLRRLITVRGGTPSSSSCPGSGLVAALESVAALFGDSSAIAVLQEGEKHGLEEYEEVLEDEKMDADAKIVIRDDLLPPLRRHVVELEMVMP